MPDKGHRWLNCVLSRASLSFFSRLLRCHCLFFYLFFFAAVGLRHLDAPCSMIIVQKNNQHLNIVNTNIMHKNVHEKEFKTMYGCSVESHESMIEHNFGNPKHMKSALLGMDLLL